VSGMGFRSVLRSAVVLQVDSGGGSFGHGNDVVVIASVGRGGADWGSAGAVAEVDGVAEFSGGNRPAVACDEVVRRNRAQRSRLTGFVRRDLSVTSRRLPLSSVSNR